MKKVMQIEPKRGFMQMAEGIVYKQIESWYGGDNRALELNVIRRPGEGPRPLIIWLTGGAWSQVSKDVHVPEVVYLVEAGFTVATVEYRTSEAAIFPAQIEDVKAAIRYLRANAARWSIDPAHVGIMGESAGGHLAALAGTTGCTREFDVGDNLDQSSSVQAVVDWYGPADFTCFAVNAGSPTSPEARLIGCRPVDNRAMAEKVSPVSYVSDKTPPFLIIHGTEDALVPFSQSEILHDVINNAGGQADLIAIEQANHGDIRFVSPEIRTEILQFFQAHLG